MATTTPEKSDLQSTHREHLETLSEQAPAGLDDKHATVTGKPTRTRHGAVRTFWQRHARHVAVAGALLIIAGTIMLFEMSNGPPQALNLHISGPWRLLAALLMIIAGFAAGISSISTTFPTTPSFNQVDIEFRARTRAHDKQRTPTRAGDEHAAPGTNETEAILGNTASFEEYFRTMQTLLEAKAEKADTKASIALDHGKRYLALGVAFYILSIITWQALAQWRGFQISIVYGIASSSLLFVSMEFLGAWFLKQYRTFVDTSTYLTKVKTIFDRYMLTFLLLREQATTDIARSQATTTLLAMLKDEVKWPDTYLLKQADVTFARDALDSLAAIAKGLRQEAVESKKAPTS